MKKYKILNSSYDVGYGQVERREGHLGLLIGLVSSLAQYFHHNSIFFVFSWRTLAPRMNLTSKCGGVRKSNSKYQEI